MTTAAWFIGLYFDGDLVLARIDLPLFTYYVPNLVFDVLTIYFAGITVKVIIRRTGMVAACTVVLNAVVAGIFALICLLVFFWGGAVAVLSNAPGTEQASARMKMELTQGLSTELARDGFSNRAAIGLSFPNVNFLEASLDIVSSVARSDRAPLIPVKLKVEEGDRGIIYSGDIKVRMANSWSNLLMAGTTFLPVLVFTVAIIFSFLAKGFLSLAKFFASHLLQLLVESVEPLEISKFMPGTILGSIFGAVAGLIKMFADL